MYPLPTTQEGMTMLSEGSGPQLQRWQKPVMPFINPAQWHHLGPGWQGARIWAPEAGRELLNPGPAALSLPTLHSLGEVNHLAGRWLVCF